MHDELKPTLYVVATPIGNLEDMSLRAIRILKEVDLILCEDTRVTKKLLDHYNIATKTESYHAHSREGTEERIINELKTGRRYALVSDAGTPSISDPGVRLVALARKHSDIAVYAVPGPSALVSALSTSGFGGNQFTFYGFLPHKKGRQSIFTDIARSQRLSIFYESPHRLLKCLFELSHHLSESQRKVAVARELTKIYETTVIGTAQEVYEYFLNHPQEVRGECVVIIDK